MVAPRQFCFDTLDGRGPRSARGSSGGNFPKWGPKWGPKMESRMGSLSEGGLPKMVAPRQFCSDTLDGRGPRSARGALRRPCFSIFQNGVQNGVQKWDPKMGSKMGSNNGVQKWGPKWVSCHHYEQPPPPTKMKNHRFPFHLGQVAGRWGGAYGGN